MKMLLPFLLAGAFLASCSKLNDNVAHLAENSTPQDSISQDSLAKTPIYGIDPYDDIMFYKYYIDAFVKCDTLMAWIGNRFVISDTNKFCITGDPDQQSILINITGSLVKNRANIYNSVIVYAGYDCTNDPCLNPVYEMHSKKVGDGAFDREILMRKKKSEVASVYTLKDIVITSDKSFGNHFPAGTDLSSFFYIIIDDIYATVRNNYVPESGVLPDNPDYDPDNPQTRRRFRMDEVNLEDYPYISADWTLFMHTRPENSGDYTFHIKATYTNGTILETDTNSIYVKGKI